MKDLHSKAKVLSPLVHDVKEGEALNSGFLQSYGVSPVFPSLSLICDDLGNYRDAERPSRLEALLNGETSPLEGGETFCDEAMRFLISTELSRFNDALFFDESLLRSDDRQRVLVVDQGLDDPDLAPKQRASDFRVMLKAAMAENPEATIYLYSPRQTSNGLFTRERRQKRGLVGAVNDPRVVVLSDEANPWSLVRHMDRVYAVSAHLGFEALMAGKPVSVFGMPWYAGWGATDDRQPCARRVRRRSVRELFAAAYLHYSRYLNPETHDVGDIFDVMHWLVRQREVEAQVTGRYVMVGFRRWKVANLRTRLSLSTQRVVRARNADRAAKLTLSPKDALVVWGRDVPDDIRDLADRTGARVLHMEDGFVRSVGLGSDMVPPGSVVLDEQGIYFDPTQASDLEHLLNTRHFSDEECHRAERVRELVVEQRLTKYNIEPLEMPAWPVEGREVVLVPGQVEDDASIRYGAGAVRTNLGLLEAARADHPDAFLVYKPHPDVTIGGRLGRVPADQISLLADHVETELSIISCIEACDTVHTMTSLSGFDALLRGRQVVTYGEPFYAGWGLTEDRAGSDAGGSKALSRRVRRLSLAELVAGALLCYPRYWDPVLHGHTTCEAMLHRIIRERQALIDLSDLRYRRLGYWQRQWRKLKVFAI